MIKVFVISPLGAKTAEEIEENVKWAQKLCRDLNEKGYNVFPAHLLYPQWYKDTDPEERNKGINFGLDWMRECNEVHVFATLRGISAGMAQEIRAAEEMGKKIIYV